MNYTFKKLKHYGLIINIRECVGLALILIKNFSDFSGDVLKQYSFTSKGE